VPPQNPARRHANLHACHRYNRIGRPEQNYWETMAWLIDQRWGYDSLSAAAVIKVRVR